MSPVAYWILLAGFRTSVSLLNYWQTDYWLMPQFAGTYGDGESGEPHGPAMDTCSENPKEH